MPCRDYQDVVETDNSSEVRALRRRNDLLMRVICAIDEHFNLTAKQMLSMRHGEEVKAVIEGHRAADAREAARQKSIRERKLAEKRKAEERAAVLATLTPAQKRALDLK